MASTSLVRSRYARYSAGAVDWLDEPPDEPRRWGGLFALVAAVAISAGATLAWCHEDQVRETLAGTFPRLGWLAPAGAAGPTSTGSSTGSSAPSLASVDQQQLQELAAGLAALRQRDEQLSQRIDQLSEQVTMLGALLSRGQLTSVAERRPRADAPVEQARSRTELEPKRLQVAAGPSPVSQEEVCKHDAARLALLRMTQERDEITVFERDLGCEELRPQVTRLRESVDPR